MIDIGGPSLLRAAGKIYKYINPIVDKKKAQIEDMNIK